MVHLRPYGGCPRKGCDPPIHAEVAERQYVWPPEMEHQEHVGLISATRAGHCGSCEEAALTNT